MNYKFQEYIKKRESEFLKTDVTNDDLIRIKDANQYFNEYIKQCDIPIVGSSEAVDWDKWDELEKSGLDKPLKNWNDDSEAELNCDFCTSNHIKKDYNLPLNMCKCGTIETI